MSASMYPPAHSLPPAIIVDYPDDTRGTINGARVVGMDNATVGQLRAAIDLQQAEVRKAADGLPQLCSLLNRRLMEGAGDGDPAMTGPGDPVFNMEVNRLVTQSQAEFERTMEDFDFNSAIDRALKLAMRAFEDAALLPDVETPGLYIQIDLERKNRPLIEALRGKDIGRADVTNFFHSITFDDSHDGLFKRRRKFASHTAARNAALEAFALEISKPGFEVKLTAYELY